MSSNLRQEVRRARSEFLREDYADRVKTLVAREIATLDPDATIETTGIFNHSAIPEFFLSWPSQTRQRAVYLRGSYSSIYAADETGRSAFEGTGIDPIFVAIDAAGDISLEESLLHERAIFSEETIRESIPDDRQTLLTDIDAIGTISDSASSEATPLENLVRANFVRGGRGLIDESRAVDLTSNQGSQDEEHSITELIASSFSADAAFRMNRTALLVELAYRAEDGSEDPWGETISGALSGAEIRAIVPWLTSRPHLRPRQSFWRQLAAHLDFSILEREIDSLRQSDLTPLFEHNLDKFYAGRAYAGLNIDEDDALEWRVVGSTIARCVGTDATKFTNVGTKLKAIGSHGLPDWDNLEPLLSDYKLERVQLRGITRSITIGAEESDDIRADIDQVVSSIDDAYRISAVSIKVPESESDAPDSVISLEFASRLAVALGNDKASINSLLRAIRLVKLE